uniref:Uncharacterized protein n=1 Tax=Plectus sambesii TaxID=2011161 RepID=A0A914WJG2_9BILA
MFPSKHLFGIIVIPFMLALVTNTEQSPISDGDHMGNGKPQDADVVDPAWSTLNESCARILRQNAKRAPFSMVGHGIHSLTVRDLRRFFDPLATEINFIPTINRDLAADYPLLQHAPDLKSPDEEMFVTDAMKAIDLSLSHMGDLNWDIKHFSPLENVVHIFHMEEVWARAQKQFEIIKKAPPSAETCACVMDIENNGVFKFLRFTALAIREPMLIYGGGMKMDSDKKSDLLGYYIPYYVYKYHFKNFNAANRETFLKEKNDAMPRLTNADVWKKWKKLGCTSVAEDYNNALFIYCAIEKSHQK